MAEALAFFGTLLALAIIFQGIQTAWKLLFPATVERARLRLNHTPWQCLWLGCLSIIILLPPLIILTAVLPLELTRIVGCLLFFTVIAFSGLGAAGLAARMGEKLISPPKEKVSPALISAGGAVALELATGFWLGGMATVIVLPLIAVSFNLSLEMIWLVGCSVLFTLLASAGLGTAISLSGKGTLLMPHDSRGISTTSALVRGSILLTLAAGFPVIGWFLITPLIIITSFGATVFALLRWMPREAAPFDHKVSSTKKLSMLSLAILWALPFVAISVLSIAFLLRGAYMLELAAGVPVIAWLIIIPVYVIVLLVASAYALARCCREKPHPIAGIQ